MVNDESDGRHLTGDDGGVKLERIRIFRIVGRVGLGRRVAGLADANLVSQLVGRHIYQLEFAVIVGQLIKIDDRRQLIVFHMNTDLRHRLTIGVNNADKQGAVARGALHAFGRDGGSED